MLEGVFQKLNYVYRSIDPDPEAYKINSIFYIYLHFYFIDFFGNQFFLFSTTENN